MNQIHATVAGVPRIGPKRELKKALENYWKEAATGRELANTALRLVNSYSDGLSAAGIDSIPTLGRSYYDSVLDTSALFGVLPERVAEIDDHGTDGLPCYIDRLFTTARGSANVPASAMTKWFDTNYHYLVPELSQDTDFRVDDAALLSDLESQTVRGDNIRPIFVGPLTYLALAKTTDGSDALELLESLFDAYGRVLTHLAKLNIEWVQFDEPYLVTDIADNDKDRAELLARTRAGYRKLVNTLRAVGGENPTKLLLQTYYGDGDRAINALSGIGISAFGVDLVTGRQAELGSHLDAELLPSWTGEEQLLAGVVDGRNIWRTDLAAALATLRALSQRGPVGVSTSCSLLHVPYTLEGETTLDDDPELKSWLAFGSEKIQEVAVLSRLLRDEATDADYAAFEAAVAAVASRRESQRTHNTLVRDRTAGITDADRTRSPFAQRTEAQNAHIQLPPLPTTTIGSFPQTADIRRARAQHRVGELTDAQYVEAMKAEIKYVVEKQEELELDVLVHGEPERNDMVQYFSEQLEGYHSTQYGWVQSYGSRCVRPPILFGDVYRPQPLTTDWFAYAQSLTDKPVKGMLTGPVTMLAWAFVRDDQPLGTTADQVAFALRDEIDDLIAAGAQIIQVDEPAIRELLPLQKHQQPAYLEWAVGSFRLATGGAQDEVQIHTHMCYSQFNELIGTVSELDADVTSIEAARAGMGVLAALRDHGFELGVGPGVWDIHSPRVPSQDEVDGLVESALASVPPRQLWLNPDCGLKTRGWAETEASLKVLVQAAKTARLNVGALTPLG